MITEYGVNNFLFTFVSKPKEKRRISALEFGVTDGGGEFTSAFKVSLNTDDMFVVDSSKITINNQFGSDTTIGDTVVEFNTVNLLTVEGKVVATRKEGEEVFAKDYFMTTDWYITMAEKCWNDPTEEGG